MATLGALFGVGFLSTSGKKATAPTPPINASSQDEADFIKYEAPLPATKHRAMTKLTVTQEVYGECRSGREEGETLE